MLISMPTGTSAIFGVFQVIASLPIIGASSAPVSNVEPPQMLRKYAK